MEASDFMSNKILLFIPMYNCQNQIIRVLNQIGQKYASLINEILIVNNRSTDNGEQVVVDYFNNNVQAIKTTLLRNKQNYGLGGSHKVAFSYAMKNEYDYIIVLHGDDQGNINDLYPLLVKGKHKQYDCLLGARFMKGSSLEGYSKFRTFGNNIYNLLFTIVTGKRIYDLGSGLNCYKVKILSDRFYHKYPDNLTFNYCMIMGSVFYKHQIKFFPISWREDDQISNVKLFNQAYKVLKMLGTYFIKKKQFLSTELRPKEVEEYIGEVIIMKERDN